MTRVIVTRPQPQASQWVSQLKGHGIDAYALPLIATRAHVDDAKLQAAWAQSQSALAVMFVSAAAVDAMAEAIGPSAVAAHASALGSVPRLWCTGLGTRARLLEVGFAADGIDAPDAQALQFDSEALWLRVGHQVRAGDRVMIVRGDDRDLAPEQSTDDPGRGRDWLAAQVRAAGAQVDVIVSYERLLPLWSEQEVAVAQTAARDGAVWLLSSSRALEHLKQLLPAQSWSLARGLCTHPRIALAAQHLGFSELRVTKPGLSEVLASIKLMA